VCRYFALLSRIQKKDTNEKYGFFKFMSKCIPISRSSNDIAQAREAQPVNAGWM